MKKIPDGSVEMAFRDPPYNLKKNYTRYADDRALSDPSIRIVALPFSRLRHLCRFERGGYCKQIRNKCDAGSCPQIPKNK